jgi:uncharacterized protein RhaS with RHS repeats
MQARYYDPVIGRFYSNDPVGFTGDVTSFNRYSYVGNNPYKYTDPDGQNRVMAMGARLIKNPTRAPKMISRAIRSAAEGAGILSPVRNEGSNVGSGVNPDVPDSSASQGGKEKKGQTSGEVGDCPTCGGETSNKPGKIGKAHDLKPKEVKDRIHGLKSGNKLHNNPDVEVCNNCGETHPQTGEGGLGDSIGNIKDEN